MATSIRRFRRLQRELLAAAVSGADDGPDEPRVSSVRFRLRRWALAFDDPAVEGLFLAVELSSWRLSRVLTSLVVGVGLSLALLHETTDLASVGLRNFGVDVAAWASGTAALCFLLVAAETFRLARVAEDRGAGSPRDLPRGGDGPAPISLGPVERSPFGRGISRSNEMSPLSLGALTPRSPEVFGVHVRNLTELHEQFSAGGFDRGSLARILLQLRRLSGLICVASGLLVLAVTFFVVAGCPGVSDDRAPRSACIAVLDGQPPLAVFVSFPIVPLWVVLVQRPQFGHTMALLVVIAISGLVALPPVFAAGLCVVVLIAGRGSAVISVTTRQQFALLFFAVDILVSEQQASRQAFRARAARDATQTIVGFASHELRNPLHIIAGINEGLLGVPDLPAVVREDLALMHESIRRMTSITGDALDLGKIQQGRLRLRPTSIAPRAMLLELAELFGERIGPVDVEFADGFPSACYADGDRLRQIIANGLENAVRNLPDAGRCSIRARAENRDAPTASEGSALATTYLIIDVASEGNGLGGVDPESLFQPFAHRDDQDSPVAWSSGLGLSVARSLTALFRGRVTIISADGTRRWYSSNQDRGRMHRVLHRNGDRPAVIHPDGSRMWYNFGQSYNVKPRKLYSGDLSLACALRRRLGRVDTEWVRVFTI